VTGGSKNYMSKLLAPLGNRVELHERVSCAQREQNNVILSLESGRIASFDGAVFAGHSDQTLAILDDANEEETAILSAVKFRPNRVILHRDPFLMPKRRAAWSAWNYLRSSRHGGESEITMTYWMNRLQGIDETKPLFVSLNPQREPRAGTVFGEWVYEHPQFDAAALAAQKRLALIQGRRNCHFAGAWTGYGFHEDGLRSGLEAAAALGASMTWSAQPGMAEAAE
jgi:predicted NAD/FAD-binding protein